MKPQEFDAVTQSQRSVVMRRAAAPMIERDDLRHVPAIQRAILSHPILQMQCVYGNRYLQRVVTRARKGDGEAEAAPGIEAAIQRARGGGQALDSGVRRQMESAFGVDFGHVRIHTGSKADALNRAVNARAFTTGSDIFFREGEYAPGQSDGRKLLAHELTHVVQQTGTIHHKLTVSQPGDCYEQEADQVARAVMQQEQQAGRTRTPTMQVSRQQTTAAIQRRVSFDVLGWSAVKLGPPTPQNGIDPRYISVPPSGQISISALVQVQGAAGDPCNQYEIGTTQTAWVAWTVAHYRGQNPREGSITVEHRPPMPMRDPGVRGDVWYDPNRARNVVKPASCGDSVDVFHIDSPHHEIPKARHNGVVPGNPLNYLRSYTRGLRLVTYLTARDPSGHFLRSPLRFMYWTSLQNFTFTPNFANPFQMWACTGQVRVNVGAKGKGATADAPYYTTSGPHFNHHFNNSANWRINERP